MKSAAPTYSGSVAPTGADPVLSASMWRDRFGGSTDVIGQSVILDRRPFRIVGVMPAGTICPSLESRSGSLEHFRRLTARSAFPRAIARLAPGVPIEQAEQQLNGVAADLAGKFPDTNRGWGVQLSPLSAETIGEAATVL